MAKRFGIEIIESNAQIEAILLKKLASMALLTLPLTIIMVRFLIQIAMTLKSVSPVHMVV